jgi:hypothetical protein
MNMVGARVLAHGGIDQPGIAMGLAHGLGWISIPSRSATANSSIRRTGLAQRIVSARRDLVRNDRKARNLALAQLARAQLGEKAHLLRRPPLVELGKEHPGQRTDLLGVEEEELHEPLDGAFARAIGEIHAQRHFALKIESQAIFGTLGDEVQVASHSPEEVLARRNARYSCAVSPTFTSSEGTRTLWMYRRSNRACGGAAPFALFTLG